ncbi:MAG: cytochrome c3 family protein [Bacillota bacterium]|nr:cytochrome c3 family protein [Bacillota bacterium]MDW7685315.1 cytochrome c3 family protein [Bacillota bacterium]
MKKEWLLLSTLVLIVSMLFYHSSTVQADDVPRRIEIVVNRLDSTYSEITFYVEGTGYNIQRFVVSKNNESYNWSWSNRDENNNAMQLTLETSGQYQGYYKYTVAQALNYNDYIYRIGKNGKWMEARVYPPNENQHTNYQKSSDTCKNCHSTHYAKTSQLLNKSVVRELCMVCHNGLGSKFNVGDGTVMTSSGQMTSSPAGPFGATTATSYHNVFREEHGMLLTAPGGGSMSLTCTDCHSAHVLQDMTKPVRSSSFRLLKHFGRPLNVYDQPPVVAYSFVTSTSYETVYVSGMNEFCSECHERYNYGENRNPKIPSYPTHTLRGDGGDGIKKSGEYYRHPTGINIAGWLNVSIDIPLEDRGVNGKYLTCKTCHYAHGTAIISGYHETFESPKYDYEGKPQTKSTMLKRREGMGICLECHLDIWYNTDADLSQF